MTNPPNRSKRKCPTCGSPKPHLHPAVQVDGEVHVCRDEFHAQHTPENEHYRQFDHRYEAGPYGVCRRCGEGRR